MNRHKANMMRAANSPDIYLRYAEAHGDPQEESKIVEMLSKQLAREITNAVGSIWRQLTRFDDKRR